MFRKIREIKIRIREATQRKRNEKKQSCAFKAQKKKKSIGFRSTHNVIVIECAIRKNSKSEPLEPEHSQNSRAEIWL